MSQFIRIANSQRVDFKSIPVLSYADFVRQNGSLPVDENYRCISYFANPEGDFLRLICCIADDRHADILVSAACIEKNGVPLPSLTAIHESFHMFEREICENFGIAYTDHPWLKPLRYAHNRVNSDDRMSRYRFSASGARNCTKWASVRSMPE